MTDDEVKRMLERIRRNGQYEYVSQAYDSTFRRAEKALEEDKERVWIQSVFADPVIGDENDRHPRSQFRTRRVRRFPQTTGYAPVSCKVDEDSVVYGWVQEQLAPQEPSELTAGDTRQLDRFLAGFVTQ